MTEDRNAFVAVVLILLLLAGAFLWEKYLATTDVVFPAENIEEGQFNLPIVDTVIVREYLYWDWDGIKFVQQTITSEISGTYPMWEENSSGDSITVYLTEHK